MDNDSKKILATVVATSFSLGFGIGYFVGKRRNRRPIYIVKKADPEPEEKPESDQLEMDFERKPEPLPVEPPVPTEWVKVDKTVTEEQMVTRLVPTGNGEWDWNTEIQHRNMNQGTPYVITYEEFINDELGYSQSTITYFAGDNILVDEEDVPIYDPQQMVGEMKFGHGSNDPNVVYIRNEKLKCEWEVLYDPGTYEEEILDIVVEKNLESRNTKSETPKFKRE